MAVLTLESGNILHDTAEINAKLAALKITLALWPVGEEQKLQALLIKPTLDNDEKEDALQFFDHYFNKLRNELGYQARDMITLSPETPNVASALSKFSKCHTHDDDEVRYIVDGEGVFGFVLPNGEQAELLVTAGDYINVPADTQHWFYLTPAMRIKAVRYFTSMAGWQPVYTETEIRVGMLSKKAA